MVENRNPSITIITPSVREKGLEIVKKSLKNQTIKNFEWIVASPFEYKDCDLWLKDPPKKKGDFWNLCKAWNKAYANAKGDLIVNVQDYVYLPPDTLERFWWHYTQNPKAIISAVGHHYDEKLENRVWSDPRVKGEMTFRKTDNTQIEMTVCSVPHQAILDCGGIDEEYDKGPGVQEKEMCLRLMVLGYEMYIDEAIEYKAVHHPRLTKDWDDKYWNVIAPLFKRHVQEMLEIKRPLNVGNIEKYIT